MSQKYISRREQDKEIIKVEKETISEFINIALASAKIKKLIVEEEKDIFEMRQNIHLFIYGEKSSTKSTLLNQITNRTKIQESFTHLTFPALVGSVDNQTKQLMVGACWECRNSLLCLDEFDFGQRNKDVIRAILQLTENKRYRRKISAFSIPVTLEEEGLYFKFENGEFNIKTRFSLILATMQFPYNSQNQDIQALISRCITIPLHLTKEELGEIARGNPLFRYEDLTPKELEITVKKNDYKKILEYVERNTDGKGTNFLRIVGDCVRIFAVLKKHRFDLYEIITILGSKKFPGES